MTFRKYISAKEGLLKLQKFCSQHERCHQEVRTKLISIGIFGDDLEEIISTLIEGNFLNEERYAIFCARDKLNLNHWGRMKIAMFLKSRGISEYCLKKGLNSLDPILYMEVMAKLLNKKLALSTGVSRNLLRYKIGAFMTSKGFEYDEFLPIMEAALQNWNDN